MCSSSPNLFVAYDVCSCQACRCSAVLLQSNRKVSHSPLKLPHDANDTVVVTSLSPYHIFLLAHAPPRYKLRRQVEIKDVSSEFHAWAQFAGQASSVPLSRSGVHWGNCCLDCLCVFLPKSCCLLLHCPGFCAKDCAVCQDASQVRVCYIPSPVSWFMFTFYPHVLSHLLTFWVLRWAHLLHLFLMFQDARQCRSLRYQVFHKLSNLGVCLDFSKQPRSGDFSPKQVKLVEKCPSWPERVRQVFPV